MDIEKLIDESDHKLYIFITQKKVYIIEWIMGEEHLVMKLKYFRDEKDKTYIPKNF